MKHFLHRYAGTRKFLASLDLPPLAWRIVNGYVVSEEDGRHIATKARPNVVAESNTQLYRLGMEGENALRLMCEAPLLLESLLSLAEACRHADADAVEAAMHQAVRVASRATGRPISEVTAAVVPTSVKLSREFLSDMRPRLS